MGTCDRVASNVLSRGPVTGSRHVQVNGPEPRCAESEDEKPPRAQWSRDVARGEAACEKAWILQKI